MFQIQLPLAARDPSTNSLAIELVTAVSSQSAVSPFAGSPQATWLTEATEGKVVACCHWSEEPFPASDPVHTAAVGEDVPGMVPIATQVVEVQEMLVIEFDPAGNVSLIQVLASPDPEEIGAVNTVGSVALDESPVPRTRHCEESGQVILPNDIASAGTTSEVKVGVHEELVAKLAGSPSRRRITGVCDAEPKIADPLISQVEEVGHPIEDRPVKVVELGAVPLHVVGVTTVHTSWLTAPARRVGFPAVVVAMA